MNDAARSPPTVSVVIAAYNAEGTIARAIQSALSQNVTVEVIVVDDASSDRTAALVEAMATQEPCLQVLRNATNAGPSVARNRAIAASSAPWIAILDADDFMDAGRLARLLEIARDTGAEFVADDLYKVDENNLCGARRRMYSDAPIGRIWLDAAAFVHGNLSSRQGGRREMGFLKPLMSRAFIEHHELTYRERVRLGEDYILYTDALLHGARFLLTDPAGYVAVVRQRSLSGRSATVAHDHLAAADREFLSRPGINSETVAALRAHLLEQQRKLAWRRLIDAKRAADPFAALACFWAPPAVVLDLTRRVLRDLSGRVARRAGSE